MKFVTLQTVEKVELIEVEEVEELEVEKILNKRKIREVTKYLVYWKRFTAEHDIWEKEEDLENIKESIVEFERRMSIKVRKQENLDIITREVYVMT